MTELPVIADPEAPIVWQTPDPSGNYFPNTGEEVVHVQGPPTGFALVFANGQPCSYSRPGHPEDHDPVRYEVAVGMIGGQTARWDPRRFNSDAGYVSFTYDPDATGILVAVQRIPVTSEDQP